MQVTDTVIAQVRKLVNESNGGGLWFAHDSGLLIDGLVVRYQWVGNDSNRLSISVTDTDYRRGAEWVGEHYLAPFNC